MGRNVEALSAKEYIRMMLRSEPALSEVRVIEIPSGAAQRAIPAVGFVKPGSKIDRNKVIPLIEVRATDVMKAATVNQLANNIVNDPTFKANRARAQDPLQCIVGIVAGFYVDETGVQVRYGFAFEEPQP